MLLIAENVDKNSPGNKINDASWISRLVTIPETAKQIIEQNHERFDGKGYPNRLTDNAITREATRAGTVAASTTAATTAVNNAITSKKPAYMNKVITVTVTFSKPSSFKDGDITVSTAYDLPPLTPLTAFLAPSGTYHIVSTYTMKVG